MVDPCPLIDIWLPSHSTYTDQAIQGAVLLNSSASQINLTLKGYESITYWQKHLKQYRRYLERKATTAHFYESSIKIPTNPESGKTAYPFSFVLPDNVPPTNTFDSTKF